MLILILEYGKNEWNYIPEDKVAKHLGQIANGEVEAVLAEDGAEILGFATFHTSTHFNRYRSSGRTEKPHGYIHEAVVHENHRRKGLGSSLLKEAVKHLRSQDFDEVYIDRHEENAASAGMMRKAGFVEVDTYIDHEHRMSGSRRTTVCRVG